MTEIQLIDRAIHAAILAGIEIRNVYSSADFNIEVKADNTPVTLADYKANEVIQEELEKTFLPILSEESVPQSYSERKNWKLFWLVDPLDGTKEFIRRNDEFTVNIALIKENRSVAGVIYAPATGELYVGITEIGAWKLSNPTLDCCFQSIQSSGEKLPQPINSNDYTVVVSRSHMNRETEKYIENLRHKHERINLLCKGSSLKICMVAEGAAHVYPKIGKTMEWDTAAGHAIAKAVGKNIFRTDLKTELTYNKENLQNPNFIVK